MVICIPIRLSKEEKVFLIRFTASFLVLFAVLKLLQLQPVNLLVAQLQEKILSSAGYSVARDGAVLFIGNHAFEMIVDCSGLVMMIMFLALLYSTKTKVAFPKILAYLAFFFVFNLFRLALTLAVGVNYGTQALGIIHPALWFVDSGVVFAAWAKEYGLF